MIFLATPLPPVPHMELPPTFTLKGWYFIVYTAVVTVGLAVLLRLLIHAEAFAAK